MAPASAFLLFLFAASWYVKGQIPSFPSKIIVPFASKRGRATAAKNITYTRISTIMPILTIQILKLKKKHISDLLNEIFALRATVWIFFIDRQMVILATA